MKLNHHGWSLKEMVLFSSILFVFFLLAVFNIIRLYRGFHENNSNTTSNKTQVNESSKNDYSYEDIEANVLSAGLDYYNKYYDNEKNVKITTSKMKQQGLLHTSDLIPEKEKKECSGYVEFENGDPFVYIKCQKYETSGYEE